MKTMKKPIVLMDAHSVTPQTGLDVAIAHAKAFQAPLRIVDTIDNSKWARAFSGPVLEDLHQEIIREKDTALRAAVARASEQGVEASFELLYGSPAFAVIREVLQNGHDVVYKTMSGDPSIRGRLLGNTARRLLRKCPGTVCLVHPAFRGTERVIAAIGPETEAGEGREMNRAILETCRMLSENSGGEVHAVQSWELYGLSMLQGRMDSEALMAQARAHYDEAYARLEGICSGYGLDSSRIHLLEGGTAEVISDFADRAESDLLVLGSYAREGLKGMLLGNTAETLLESLQCSVVTLKSPDFVSPLAS